VVNDITEQRQLERELVKAGERERKRVGRDLHDGLGQLLTGIGFLSKTLSQSLTERGDQDADEAAEITTLVENAIDQTRSLSKLLLPVELEVNGLEAALQRLKSHVSVIYGITCELKTGSYSPIQDPEIALHMYRVAQEAVHNAVRHGKPSKVEVTLSTRSGKTRLHVADDGIGLPEGADQKGGLGLRTMQYRAQTIGATLTVSRRKKGGTHVCCELPANVEERPEVSIEPI
jgi:signal transduction histidine kinase